MLELRDVSLLYNPGSATETLALDSVSLVIPTGQFVTVVGSNGAGKSSMIKVASGAERPTRGTVHIAGEDVTALSDYRRAGRVARVFDNPQVGTAPDLSIEDNMALALSRGQRRRLRPALDVRRRSFIADKLAELGLGLERRLVDPVGSLSAGQRQSVTMVMAALTTPDVLLLDEHLAALDPATQTRVLDITIRLVAELGCTTLMVTHNMDHAIRVGDRLLVMSRGRVVADIAGEEKARLSVGDVVERITAAGDTASDRLLLEEAG